MQIFVKLPSFGIITLDVEEEDTIKTIKEKVVDKEGFPCIHYFRLYNYGNLGRRLLEDDKTLLYYNIKREKRIYLELEYYLPKLKLKIFYNKNILEINECTICFSSTVLTIKKLIKEEFKIKTNEIIIIHNDKILNDEIILKNLGKMYLELLVAKKGLPIVKVINDKDILMTFNLKLTMGHQAHFDIKKSIEKYYDLPIKNQIIYFEDGCDENCYCCNFYSEIPRRSKKIIIRENNGIFSSFFKNSVNEVEIYQIFLRLRKNDFKIERSDVLPLPKIINGKQDEEKKEENKIIDNNKNIIDNNLELKLNNDDEEDEIGEQKIFRTIYTRNKKI